MEKKRGKEMDGKKRKTTYSIHQPSSKIIFVEIVHSKFLPLNYVRLADLTTATGGLFHPSTTL
jgi:hypothetical protein